MREVRDYSEYCSRTTTLLLLLPASACQFNPVIGEEVVRSSTGPKAKGSLPLLVFGGSTKVKDDNELTEKRSFCLSSIEVRCQQKTKRQANCSHNDGA
jgi:hypothetical protein